MEIHPLLDPLALRRDGNYRYELIKTGQVIGDDGNWSLIVSGTQLLLQVKVSGSWKPVVDWDTPS